MNKFSIKKITAREILDSRGNPTVEAEVELEGGGKGVAAVPSGASTGKFEAFELRDHDADRYEGQGVLRAVANDNNKIFTALRGRDAQEQEKLDTVMIELDGSPNKRNLGANAILAVSLAMAKSVAAQRREPLYACLRQIFNLAQGSYKLPAPLMNIINGGKHASTNLALQEFQIIPLADGKFSSQLEMGSEVFHCLAKVLAGKNMDTDVGNEGGYAPDFVKLEDAFDCIMEAAAKAGAKPGENIFLGLDAAANSFYDKRENVYVINPPTEKLDPAGLAGRYLEWMEKYPLVSIEDPFGEESWEDWRNFLTQLRGKKYHEQDFMVIGDDLFVTNVVRLKRGIKEKAANAILIKPNQIGTLSETAAAIKLAQENNFKTIISHRSGETNDTTIADLAVAFGADFIKTGAPSRGERVAKYNRLLEIEQEIG